MSIDYDTASNIWDVGSQDFAQTEIGNMNSITRHHYPAAKLPSDLRQGINPADNVTVTIVVEEAMDQGLSLSEILLLPRAPYRSIEEIDADLERDRDEWDK